MKNGLYAWKSLFTKESKNQTTVKYHYFPETGYSSYEWVVITACLNEQNEYNGCPAAEISNYHRANSFNTIAKSLKEMTALAIFFSLCLYKASRQQWQHNISQKRWGKLLTVSSLIKVFSLHLLQTSKQRNHILHEKNTLLRTLDYFDLKYHGSICGVVYWI